MKPLAMIFLFISLVAMGIFVGMSLQRYLTNHEARERITEHSWCCERADTLQNILNTHDCEFVADYLSWQLADTFGTGNAAEFIRQRAEQEDHVTPYRYAFASVERANSYIERSRRYIGLTVPIKQRGKPKPAYYWYFDGIEDSCLKLKPKQASSAQTSAG